MRKIGVVFYDHSIGDETALKPTVCCVLGFLYAEDEIQYHVASWVSDNRIDHNAEVTHILKSCVIDVFEISTKRFSKKLLAKGLIQNRAV